MDIAIVLSEPAHIGDRAVMPKLVQRPARQLHL